jgi:uncharacterized OB-fold protein
MSTAAPLHRPLPVLDMDNRAFWTGGAQGTLLIAACGDCGYLVHPPTDFCPSCEGRRVAPKAVSGRGTIISLTVNHRAWYPDLPVPYVVALVALEEQEDVRLVSNIVDCDPLAPRIGDRVRVKFEQCEEVFVPLFVLDLEA